MALKKYLIGWLGVATCIALLLPNHYSPWLSFHQEAGVALAFSPLLVWATWSVARPAAPTWAVLLLTVMPLTHIVTGQLYFAGDGWMAALYLVGFALAISAGQWLQAEGGGEAGNTPSSFDPLWSGLLVAGLISVAIAAHQWLMLGLLGVFIADLPPNSRPFANLAQPNHLATALLLAIAGLISLFESRRVRPILAGTSAVFLVMGLLMTGSRSVLLAIAWMIPAYLLMRRRCVLRTHPAVFLGLVVFYLVGAVLWPLICEALLIDGAQNASINRMNGLGVRSIYWMSMFDALASAPWFGYGWGQAGLAQYATALDHAATHTFFESAHNIALDLALWNGVPIATCVIGGVIAWLVWQFRSVRSPGQWTMLVALCVVLSHSLVEYPLHYAYFLLPVGFWVGALTAANPSGIDLWLQRHAAGVGRPVMMSVTLAAGVLIALVVRDYAPYEEDWRLMRFQEARIGDLKTSTAPPTVVLDNLHALLTMAKTEAQPAMSSAELDVMRMVSQRYAYPSLMYKYARALALNGAPDSAALVLAKLCKMHPVSVCVAANREWSAIQNGKSHKAPTLPRSIIDNKIKGVSEQLEAS